MYKYKYAEIYGGKVRDLKFSNLNYTDFCSIFSPTSYWLDATGVNDIAIGYIIKFTPERGTYFEAPTPVIDDSFEAAKAGKLERLNGLFGISCTNAYVDSSLGFRADANDEASRNVGGLVTLLEATPTETIQFCDYYNAMHTLALADLKVLEKEIIQNGSALYQQKWVFRSAIEAAQTKEDLEAVVISFSYMSFTSNAIETQKESVTG